MSLLNEALRELDQRQQGEKRDNPVPAGLQDNRSGRPWLTAGLSAALVLMSLLALWFWLQGAGGETSPGEEVQSTASPAPVANPATVSPSSPAPDPSVAPIAEPVPQPRETARASLEEAGAGSEVTDTEATETETQAPAPAEKTEDRQTEPEDAPQPMAQSSGSDTGDDTGETNNPDPGGNEAASRPQQTVSQNTDTQETGSDRAVRSTSDAPEAESTPVRQLSPQQVEARIARDIREQLARGDIKDATEQARRRLAQDSDSPATRAAMASHFLRLEQPVPALEWLPDGVTSRYPGLRLLRARAELQQGEPRQALGWLNRDLPPVASHSRYHVTLAALQQQLGQHEAAATTWARLIEHDDSQARWWAGLGIALEGQGRNESARRAFVQASALPGLNDTLQRYVQRRLRDGSPTSGNR